MSLPERSFWLRLGVLRPGRRVSGSVALVAILIFTVGAGADTTAPIITPSITGTSGANGWKVSDTTVSWSTADPESGIAQESGCDTTTLHTDTTGTSVTCSATNQEGLSGAYTATIKIDKTPPTVTSATPARPADRSGWYNHAIGFTVGGSDATSGVGNCPLATYSGPDRASATISPVCTDNAGNSGRASFPLKYDATAPKVRAKPGRPPDRYGWYGHDLLVRFVGRDSLSGVAACSRELYGRPNSERAAVSGSCLDRAGNTSLPLTFRFKYSEPLLTPRQGARVSAPLLLNWVNVPRARFYNVQVWHEGRKVLTRWPRASQSKLRRTWTFAGRRYRLEAGIYTWYVWPRFARRYGEMIGKSTFRVQRRG
jgi:hypothetical protein